MWLKEEERDWQGRLLQSFCELITSRERTMDKADEIFVCRLSAPRFVRASTVAPSMTLRVDAARDPHCAYAFFLAKVLPAQACVGCHDDVFVVASFEVDKVHCMSVHAVNLPTPLRDHLLGLAGERARLWLVPSDSPLCVIERMTGVEVDAQRSEWVARGAFEVTRSTLAEAPSLMDVVQRGMRSAACVAKAA